MSSLRAYSSVVCGLLIACGSEPPAQKLPNAFSVFPNLPLPPDPEFISRAGSTDALQLTLFSPAEAASVTSYYREALSKGVWRLVSDVKKPDGSVVLYAEQNGPPLWARIYPTSDNKGTMVELTGALASLEKDSSKRGKAGTGERGNEGTRERGNAGTGKH